MNQSQKPINSVLRPQTGTYLHRATLVEVIVLIWDDLKWDAKSDCFR